MGFGLEQYKDTDKELQLQGAYRFIFAIGFTAAYYTIAKRNNIFMQSNHLNISTGLFSLLSFYYSRGFGLHFTALNANCQKHKRIRDHQLENYSRNPKNFM
jgi:hypothetical protein